jgi:hypothetical protein
MDPQDPLENAEAAAASLVGAAILVVPRAGHGSSQSSQYGCLPNVVARFYAQGHLSTADSTCAGNVAPPTFEVR